MIPKIIHYCCYGDKKISHKAEKCIASWKKYCPEYQIIKWDGTNTDFKRIDALYEAYKNEKWAFVSDIVRLLAVYEMGGIYMDTDVEIIRPIDDLLENHCYFGFENKYRINTGHGFGAEPGNQIIGNMIKEYENIAFYDSKNRFKVITCSIINTQVLRRIGLQEEDRCQTLGTVKIYSSDYFCPKNYQTGRMQCTSDTYSIHHYEGSWLPVKLRLKLCYFHMIGDKGLKIHTKIKNFFKRTVNMYRKD